VSLKPPILIVGSMRSGKSTLAEVLSLLPGVCAWVEPSVFFSTGHALRRTDVATAADAKPWVRRHMQSETLEYQQSHGGCRVIIEGPQTTFKVGFLHAVFPDAKIIHIYRDGRIVVRERLADERINRQFPMVSPSTMQRIRQQLDNMHWRDLLALPLKGSRTVLGRLTKRRWYGPRYPGWRQDRRKSPTEVAAQQWAMSVEHAMEDLSRLPPDAWTSVRCETFLSNPACELRRLIDFCGLIADDTQLAKLVQSVRDRAALWSTAPPDDAETEQVLPIMRPQLARLGYL
jgi:hypothetical protein